MTNKFALAVEIEINSDCNLACPYCPNSKAERVEKGRMERSLFVEILTQLQSIHFDGRISYHFYNEPTLSPDLDHFIELTRQYLPKARIDLYSNGTQLDQTRIEKLSDLGVDKFSLTKHYKSETSGLEAALKLDALKPEVLNKVRFQNYKDLSLTNRGGALNIRLQNLVPPLTLPCFIPECALVITVKGNVVPCYEDYFQKHIMGNVKEQSLIEIWQSNKYQEFRNSLKRGERSKIDVCKDCNNAWVIS